tara:strand:- start:158 stop:598 length:441 start_codon:yes stop_codon:yes gene_type:complete
MSEPITYGGIRVKVVDAKADPLIFRCSSGDPHFVFENSNSKSAEIRLNSNTGNYVAVRADENISTSFTMTLPPDIGEPGNILATDGNNKLYWTNFTFETTIGESTLYFGPSEDTPSGTWRIQTSATNFFVEQFNGSDWVVKFNLAN